MCKKLAVAAVVCVLAGYVLFNTQTGSLLLAYIQDLGNKAEKHVPPEKRVEQIKLEIKKIDQTIKDEIRVQGKMEDEYDAEQLRLKSLRIKQAEAKARVKLLRDSITKADTQVALPDGKTVQASSFAAELEKAAREFETLTKNIEASEQNQKVAKEAIDEHDQKIRTMIEERDKLNTAVKELERDIQQMRRKQVRNRNGDDQVSKTWELLDKTRQDVKSDGKQSELEDRYLSKRPAPDSKVTNEEALKLADKVLGDETKPEAKAEAKKPQ